MTHPSVDPSPVRAPVEAFLHALHARYRADHGGRVADYIPELGLADPSAFGICIATRDGHVYEVGDTRREFTIQSISKALVYGLALEDRGEDEVLAHIGVEPSGEAFNAISLRPETGAPFNPMINAGAIAATGLVRPDPGASRIDRVLAYLSRCAGRDLSVDDAVYESESRTGHRNRAIGWLLRNFEILGEDPTDVLETYFQQCAIRVTCRDLALIGATLASHGTHPVTTETAMAPDVVDRVLSVMASCGMYDFSGEWLLRVGLPAKSGVGGGILAVLPGELGIGIYSPPLDEHGNSYRGVRVCQDLSRDLHLHLFRVGGAARSPIRRSYDQTQISSRRRRSAGHRAVLSRHGHRIRVLELQGELHFSATETVLRAMRAEGGRADHFILDFRNVVAIDAVSRRLLDEFARQLDVAGGRTFAAHGEVLGDDEADAGRRPERRFDDIDGALEHCENRVLASVLGEDVDDGEAVSLADCDLLLSCSAEDIAWLESRLSRRTYSAGDIVVRTGDSGDELFVLARGSIEIQLPGADGGRGRRVETVSAGMTFGEMAFMDGSRRSADAVARAPSTCFVLDAATFARMTSERPELKIRLLTGITQLVSTHLRRVNVERAIFAD